MLHCPIPKILFNSLSRSSLGISKIYFLDGFELFQAIISYIDFALLLLNPKFLICNVLRFSKFFILKISSLNLDNIFCLIALAAFVEINCEITMFTYSLKTSVFLFENVI